MDAGGGDRRPVAEAGCGLRQAEYIKFLFFPAADGGDGRRPAATIGDWQRRATVGGGGRNIFLKDIFFWQWAAGGIYLNFFFPTADGGRCLAVVDDRWVVAGGWSQAGA